MFVFVSLFEMDRVEEVVVDWIQLRAHPNYDIQSVFPFMIRRRSNNRIIALTPNNGYLVCSIDGRLLRHHRIIAEQFIPNPENLREVDHINHIKDDNHLQNLRWVSRTNNCRNKSSSSGVEYTFDAELPAEAIVVEEHAGHQYINYYYHDGTFWFYTGEAYRRLHVNTHARTGCRFVIMFDDEGVKHGVSLSAYQRTIGEII
jgi:hypothetical protein